MAYLFGLSKTTRVRNQTVCGLRWFVFNWIINQEREIVTDDGRAVNGWYMGLTEQRGLCEGTALRHFNVMHHMMEKAATIWSKETGIDRNPADLVEVKRPDDQRERYLSAEEIASLKAALDSKMHRKDHSAVNQTFYRLRLLVLIALTTGMRIAEIFALTWSDIQYREGLIAVRSKLKGGKIRYVPLTAELAAEIQRYPAVIGEDRIFPPKCGAKGERQRVEGSFETVLELAGITNFRFHDLRHSFASWFDEWRRPLRTGENPRAFEHQNDRAIRKAGKETYRQDRRHRE